MAEGVKQFKDVTITYEGAAGGTLTISTDMPGSAMALRRTISMQATSGRFTKTFPLDNPSLLEGKLIQFKVASTGVLILYEGSVRVRPVGEYIDGAAGDIWETQPLSLGG